MQPGVYLASGTCLRGRQAPLNRLGTGGGPVAVRSQRNLSGGQAGVPVARKVSLETRLQ